MMSKRYQSVIVFALIILGVINAPARLTININKGISQQIPIAVKALLRLFQMISKTLGVLDRQCPSLNR